MLNVDLIREISWVLSVASQQNMLDVPGEYIWAYPKNKSLDELKVRSCTIFSSGNAIKDAEINSFVQQSNIAAHLKDPWIVKKFEERFFNWVKENPNHKIKNLDLFKYTAFAAGSQETFSNFYLTNRNKRFRVFKGEYWWHMDVWSSLGLSWAYIEDDEIRSNDTVICSYPFALFGRKHPQFDWLLDEVKAKNCKLLLDFIYLPNTCNEVEVDLQHECIDEISFSFSKTFPVQCAKIAVRMLKNKPIDMMQISNDENICNRLSAGLGLDIMNNFPMNYMYEKYKDKQQFWCSKLGLTPSPVVHFGTGDDYTAYGKKHSNRWFSEFNNQQGRYNLGMLYENENLLYNLNYI